MSSTPHPSTAPTEWRTTLDLALLVSTIAVTFALALRWFAGIGEAPIVLATLAVASFIGWRQPAARVAPVETDQLEPSGPQPAC